MRLSEKRQRLQDFEAACRERGLALTVQRRRILDFMLDRQDHPTADDVYAEVKAHLPGVSRTTVYRVLDALVDVGAIVKASSFGASTRYDPTIRRHHHLVCLHCDRLIDLNDTKLDGAVELPLRNEHAFDIQDFSIHFYGVCATCRRKRKTRFGTPRDTSGRAKKRITKTKRNP